MDIVIVACGVFEPELNRVLPELAEKEFPDHNLRVVYLEMALHNDIGRLKPELEAALGEYAGAYRTIVLYGHMCHPEIKDICRHHAVYLPTEKNCIDMFVSDEEQRRIAGDSEMFFLTDGWFVNWRDSLGGNGWDTYDARMNFGRYDTFLLLDTMMKEYTDEEQIEFFEYTTVPIEIESVSLERFTAVIRQSILAVLNEESADTAVVHARTQRS